MCSSDLLLASRYGGFDPRTVGSRNPGALNVFRTTGRMAGAWVAVLDAAKGVGGVLLARQFGGEAGGVVAGVAAVAGHVFPVWLGFRGGKGVATACGVFAVLAPAACLAGVGVFLATAWWSRYVSAGSVAAAITVPALAAAMGSPRSVVAASIAIGMLVVVRHWENLVRMQRGSERRFGRRAVHVGAPADKES